MSRSRSYCFTLNNYTEDEEKNVIKLNGVATYVCYGREVGESGTPHLQGFVQFASGKSLSAAKRALPRAHLEVRKGSITQAVEYCQKDGDFHEVGTRPLDSAGKGSNEKERWENVRELARAGRVEEIDADVYVRFYGTLRRIAKDHMAAVSDLEGCCGEWYWGVPGAGKSYIARQENPGAYLKMANKWWDGYQGEDVVIMDECELSAGNWAGHHLKIWADRYAFIAEIKGEARRIRPKKIIVTSNYSLEQIFGIDDQLVSALKRRFKVKHFGHVFGQSPI